MKRRSALALLGLFAASALGSPHADRAPTSKPAGLPTTRPGAPLVAPMPEPYRHLLTRSMFSRTPGAGAGTENAMEASARAGKGPPGPEGTMAFRGATREDGEFVAFVEDTAGGGVRQIRAGDSIATGRVAEISLDALTYESKGRKSRIAVGHNLAGAALPPASQPSKPKEQGPKGPPGSKPEKGPRPPGGKPPADGEIQVAPGGKGMRVTVSAGAAEVESDND